MVRSRLFIKLFSVIHKLVYRLTGGRIMGSARGVQFLLLTTIGCRTGKERTTPLQYLPDGDNLVVVASNGGAEQDPHWWLNLKRNPRARVQIRDRVMAVTAEKASPEERARLWPLLVQRYPGYEDYQRGIKREIPVVILRPEQTPSGEA